MTLPTLDATDVISLLALETHPQGGYFRETFRDSPDAAGRAASTAIYFLLKADQISRWHRVDAAEVWHWYAGAPLALSVARDGGPAATIRLGADLKAGERPQAVVPAFVWQRAQSLGDWTLAGCTVAPGFTFDGFEMAGADFAPEQLGRDKSI